MVEETHWETKSKMLDLVREKRTLPEVSEGDLIHYTRLLGDTIGVYYGKVELNDEGELTVQDGYCVIPLKSMLFYILTKDLLDIVGEKKLKSQRTLILT